MGSNRRLIISATGFPGTNQTLRFMQDAWSEPLKALAMLAGDKTILSGVVVTGSNVSAGFVAINGEILPFEAGTLQAQVTIIEQVAVATYEDDGVLPAYKTRHVAFGSGGVETFNFASFTRLKTILELSNFTLPNGIVIDPNYLAFTQAMLNHLNSIQSGAEVNVQADWNETDNLSDAFIRNKPSIVQSDWNVVNPLSPAFIKNKPTTIEVLHRGIAILGDFPTSTLAGITVNFPSVGTSDYTVIGTMRSHGNAGVDVIAFVTRNWSPSSFELIGREFVGANQDLQFHYLIIRN